MHANEHTCSLLGIWQEGIVETKPQLLAYVLDELVVWHHEKPACGWLLYKYVNCSAHQYKYNQGRSASNPRLLNH